jgi:ParB family chromosome partitioning protein
MKNNANENKTQEKARGQLVWIPIDQLYSHPDNPRKELGNLSELAESIKQKGIMQNLTVVPRGEGGYTVVIGHRRTGAAKLAGLTELPCVITSMTDQEQVATMLLENIQRSDLSPFEQAQGFQMMIDLGDSVEGISDKTGFSKTTVRRRLKMAELNQETLKRVSERQLSLLDIDRLAEIEDIQQRDKVLEQIGTNNFNSALANAIKKQNIEKNLPIAKEQIKKLHANKIRYSETYSSKYERAGSTIYIYEWDPRTPLVEVKDGDVRKLYYYLDEDRGWVSFYVERPRVKPVKRPKAELDREKYITETREKLEELSADAYRLRSEFVQNFRAGSKTVEQLLEGAVIAAMFQAASYVSGRSNEIKSVLGIDGSMYGNEMERHCLKNISEKKLKVYHGIIYAAFSDDARFSYWRGYGYSFPEHNENVRLDALYDWLISLGYEMSDEERQLRDGTHPLFIDKDKVKKSDDEVLEKLKEVYDVTEES